MLKDVFPNAHFGPPVSERVMEAAEQMLGTKLPDQLRRLYSECDGFREQRGNAKYLLSLLEDDYIGSLVTITRHLWAEIARPDLKPFIFFGSSSADEMWGINPKKPSEIIAYHHHMEDQYEVVGTDIVQVWQTDYARYDELGHGQLTTDN